MSVVPPNQTALSLTIPVFPFLLGYAAVCAISYCYMLALHRREIRPSVHFSDEFCISCGTVTVDFDKSKMLLIRCIENGAVCLPKGKKNIGEALDATAIRETYEETGYHVALIKVPHPTLATIETDTKGLHSMTEPMAFTQRIDGSKKKKLIYWYLAKGNSSAQPDAGTQQEGEDFEPLWLEYATALGSLTFNQDKQQGLWSYC